MTKESVKNFFKRFNLFDYLLLTIGLLITIIVSIIFKGNIFAILTSLIGIVAVFLNAKGYIVGAILAIIQCLFYAVISFKNALFGEVIIYIALLIPLNIILIFQWIKNRSVQDKMIVKINKISIKETLFVFLFGFGVFVVGYFILKAFNTANLILSTLSITICIVANYFNIRRVKLSFIIFVLNNIIIIVMWFVTAMQSKDLSVLPIIVCCFTNCVSNIYGYFVWTKLYSEQNNKILTKE